MTSGETFFTDYDMYIMYFPKANWHYHLNSQTKCLRLTQIIIRQYASLDEVHHIFYHYLQRDHKIVTLICHTQLQRRVRSALAWGRLFVVLFWLPCLCTLCTYILSALFTLLHLLPTSLIIKSLLSVICYLLSVSFFNTPSIFD